MQRTNRQKEQPYAVAQCDTEATNPSHPPKVTGMTSPTVRTLDDKPVNALHSYIRRKEFPKRPHAGPARDETRQHVQQRRGITARFVDVNCRRDERGKRDLLSGVA